MRTKKTYPRTFRRDALRRLAEKGRLMLVRADGPELPVRLQASHADHREGWANFTAHDFTAKSGHAAEQADGTIVLYIHSNESHRLRVLPEGQTAAPVPAPRPPAPLPPPAPTRAVVPFVPAVGMRVRALFARLNRRPTLAEYREECSFAGRANEDLCQIERIWQFTPAEWDAFTVNLLADDPRIAGQGGTRSDANLPADWEFLTGTDAERGEFLEHAYRLVILVAAPGRETFLVDPQGYQYARHVGLDPVPVSPAPAAAQGPAPLALHAAPPSAALALPPAAAPAPEVTVRLVEGCPTATLLSPRGAGHRATMAALYRLAAAVEQATPPIDGWVVQVDGSYLSGTEGRSCGYVRLDLFTGSAAEAERGLTVLRAAVAGAALGWL